MENGLELRKSINDIVLRHKTNYDRYNEKQHNLLQTIKFSKKHKFDEEKRIANIKFNEINLIIYDYKSLLDEVNELKRQIKIGQ